MPHGGYGNPNGYSNPGGNPNGGYGNQNRAAYDAMMGMGDFEEMAPEGAGAAYGAEPVANYGDMNIGQEGQDTPPEEGMYPGNPRQQRPMPY